MRILLADDNEEFRRRLVRFLAPEAGLDVVAFAASGEEAVVKAQEIGPDLILMDLSMPGMNGLEAARRIKARAGAPRVVIVTLYGGYSYRAAAESARADGFLSKADLVRDLLPLITTLFSSPAAGPAGCAT